MLDETEHELAKYQWHFMPNEKRSIFQLKNCLFQDVVSGSNLSLENVLNNLNNNKLNILLQGDLIPPSSNVKSIRVSTDIDGYYFNVTNSTEEPTGLWMWEENNYYLLQLGIETEDGKYCDSLLNYFESKCQDWAIGEETLRQLLKLGRNCPFFVVGKYSNIHFRIRLITNTNNVQRSVLFVGTEIGELFNWPGEIGLDWRCITDYKLTCDNKLVAVHELPFLDSDRVYILHGYFRPLSPNITPIRVEIEVNTVHISFGHHVGLSSGYYLRNSHIESIFILEGDSAVEYVEYMNQTNNIQYLYKTMTSCCDINKNQQLIVDKTIQRIHENSNGLFDLQFILSHKQHVLSTMGCVIEYQSSRPFIDSLTDVPVTIEPIDSSLGKRPRVDSDADTVKHMTNEVTDIMTICNEGLKEIADDFQQINYLFPPLATSLDAQDTFQSQMLSFWWTSIIKIYDKYDRSSKADSILLDLVLNKFNTHSEISAKLYSEVLLKSGRPNNLITAHDRWINSFGTSAEVKSELTSSVNNVIQENVDEERSLNTVEVVTDISTAENEIAHTIQCNNNTLNSTIPSRSRSDIVCPTCNVTGHDIKDCIVRLTKNKIREIKKERNESVPPRITINTYCINCDKPGHFASVCHSKKKYCVKCSQTGHRIQYCFLAQQSITSKGPHEVVDHLLSVMFQPVLTRSQFNATINELNFCTNCEYIGHNFLQCRKPCSTCSVCYRGFHKKRCCWVAQVRSSLDKVCICCESSNHSFKTCRHYGSVRCYMCLKTGHLTKYCSHKQDTELNNFAKKLVKNLTPHEDSSSNDDNSDNQNSNSDNDCDNSEDSYNNSSNNSDNSSDHSGEYSSYNSDSDS